MISILYLNNLRWGKNFSYTIHALDYFSKNSNQDDRDHFKSLEVFSYGAVEVVNARNE